MSDQTLLDGTKEKAARKAAAAIYLIHRPKHSLGRIVPQDGSPSIFRPTIICTRRVVARWEAGWSGDLSSVWSHEAAHDWGGWLTHRSNGLDIDYGHIVRGMTLGDGNHAGFVHDRDQEPWTLLRGAVWWSPAGIPPWLIAAGVVFEREPRNRRWMAERYEDKETDSFLKRGNW